MIIPVGGREMQLLALPPCEGVVGDPANQILEEAAARYSRKIGRVQGWKGHICQVSPMSSLECNGSGGGLPLLNPRRAVADGGGWAGVRVGHRTSKGYAGRNGMALLGREAQPKPSRELNRNTHISCISMPLSHMAELSLECAEDGMTIDL